MIPVRWTAPEGLNDDRYSSASDVWSFGITCIEIFQDAVAPYADLTSNPAVISMVNARKVHAQPAGCTKQVYTELVRCFSFEPVGRPDFPSLQTFFARMAEPDNRIAQRDTGSVLLNSSISVLQQNAYASFINQCGSQRQSDPHDALASSDLLSKVSVVSQPPMAAQLHVSNTYEMPDPRQPGVYDYNKGARSAASENPATSSSDDPADVRQFRSSRSSMVNVKAGFSALSQSFYEQVGLPNLMRSPTTTTFPVALPEISTTSTPSILPYGSTQHLHEDATDQPPMAAQLRVSNAYKKPEPRQPGVYDYNQGARDSYSDALRISKRPQSEASSMDLPAVVSTHERPLARGETRADPLQKGRAPGATALSNNGVDLPEANSSSTLCSIPESDVAPPLLPHACPQHVYVTRAPPRLGTNTTPLHTYV